MGIFDDSFLNFDNLSEGDDDPELPILHEFLDRWESAESQGERDAIVRGYCESQPRLADRFRGLVEATNIVRGAKEQDPAQLGPYRIVRVLAIGGMGKVYEAEDMVLHRTVAVKTIRIGQAASSELIERFEYEREALARLHHTNIVPIYSAGLDGGLLYFAMPLVKGLSLGDLVATMSRWPSGSGGLATPTSWEEILVKAETDATWRRSLRRMSAHPAGSGSKGPAPEDAPRSTASDTRVPPLTEDYFRHVAEVLAVAADALHSAHEEGVVHFDVKPSNILIERFLGHRGAHVHTWVIDFGLADTGNLGADGSSREDAGHRERTRGFGTKGFMAPEMLMRRDRASVTASHPSADRSPLGCCTDIWSLGVTLYQLLTLHMPFSDDPGILDPTVTPVPPRALVPHLPRELEAVVLKALQKTHIDRYATAADLAADLRRWLSGFPTDAGRATPGERLAMWARRKPAAAFAAGMAAAFVLVSLLGAAAETARAHAEAENSRLKIDAIERDLQAKKRSLDLLAVQRLRQPTRQMSWFANVWKRVSSLRAGGRSPDPSLQGQAAAALEGIDARVEKTIPGNAQAVEFDPRSGRLLILRASKDEKGKPSFRTTLWERATDRNVVERDLGNGVVAFRPDGTPLQLSWDRNNPARLRLYDILTGNQVRTFGSPLGGRSALPAITLSRNGARLAAMASPVRPGEQGPVPETDGATTIAVWDAGSEQPIRKVKHKATQDLILSPDGRLLAAWDIRGEITVWTLPDGNIQSHFRVGRCPVSRLAFGRDPVWHEDNTEPPWLLAVGESSGLITVWDPRAQRPRSVCRGSYIDVRVMDFSADGALLLTAGRSPTKLWDVATGTCLLDLNGEDYLQAITFAPDGRHYAVGSNAAVEVVELELGRGVRTLYGVQGRVEKTAFSPDGRLIAAATHEWQIGLWEWPSGRLLGVLPVPVGWFIDSIGMAFDADGRRFACSAGHQAQLWDIPIEQPTKRRDDLRLIKQWDGLHEGLCDSLTLLAPDRLLLIRSETRSGRSGPFTSADPGIDPRVVRIYDLLGPTPKTALHEIPDFPLHVYSIALAPDGSKFLVNGLANKEGEKIHGYSLYDSRSGERLHNFWPSPGSNAPGGAQFDSTGKVLAVMLDFVPGSRQHLNLFELPSLEYRGVTDAFINCLGPGATWALGMTDGEPPELNLSETTRGRPLLRMIDDVGSSFLSFNFSPNGRYAVFGRKDGTVAVLDLVEMNRRLSELHLGW